MAITYWITHLFAGHCVYLSAGLWSVSSDWLPIKVFCELCLFFLKHISYYIWRILDRCSRAEFIWSVTADGRDSWGLLSNVGQVQQREIIFVFGPDSRGVCVLLANCSPQSRRCVSHPHCCVCVGCGSVFVCTQFVYCICTWLVYIYSQELNKHVVLRKGKLKAKSSQKLCLLSVTFMPPWE